MSQFAFIAHQNSLYVGWGAFVRHAEPIQDAFYINNFDLSESQPWLQFENFRCFRKGQDSLDLSLLQEFIGQLPLTQKWMVEDSAHFKTHYSQALEAFESQGLKKILLSICDRLDQDSPVSYLSKIPSFETEYFYAWNIEEGGQKKGAWGLSPELLFDFDRSAKQISTMALAGTFETRSEARHLPEHQEVLSFLNDLAQRNHLKMQLQETKNVSYGALQHLKTEVLFLGADPHRSLEAWIREFHPTPALGVSPRTSQNLNLLRELRVHLPSCFGAPFGVFHDELCRMIVMIRGVFYLNKDLCRPIGVGVTPASNMSAEWSEIELKRSVLEKMWNPLI